jgi:hypothetical protein
VNGTLFLNGRSPGCFGLCGCFRHRFGFGGRLFGGSGTFDPPLYLCAAVGFF